LGPALRRNTSFLDVVAGLKDGSGRGGGGGGGVVVVVELGGGREGRWRHQGGLWLVFEGLAQSGFFPFWDGTGTTTGSITFKN
jgi:hypothetical protein